MKALLVNGSPHPRGCTYTALTELKNTLEAEDIEVELLHVGNKDIRGCIACRKCAQTGKCVFDDVVNEVVPKLAEADAFVIGCPVYFASPAGGAISFMQYRTLGSDLTVSAVGLGCMGMSHAYGAPADKKEMTELLAQAVDLGYTFFDTAEVYGTPEHPHDNEELVGAALKPYRDKIVLATKFGIHFDMSSTATNKPLVPDSRPEVIRASVEASLKRLGTDHIDLYYQHRLDPKIPIEEVAGVMADLIREGKITHWGLSEATEDTIRRAHAVCPVTAIQNRYSMMARWYENLFPVLEELHIGYVAFSPLANGFLSGKYDKSSQFDAETDYRSVMPQFQPENIDRNHDLLTLLQKLAEQNNATPAQISLAWMLCKKPYLVPIPGTRRLSRLLENAGAADVTLSAEEVSVIDETLNGMEMSEVFGGSKNVNR